MAKKRYNRKWNPMKTNDKNFIQGEKTKLMRGKSEVAYFDKIYKNLDRSLLKESKAEKKAAAKEAKKK